MPAARAAGFTSRSAARWTSEYSTCVETSGTRPGQASCHAAAHAVCQPEKFDTPT